MCARACVCVSLSLGFLPSCRPVVALIEDCKGCAIPAGGTRKRKRKGCQNITHGARVLDGWVGYPAHLVRRMDCLVGEVKEQALLGIVGI